MGLQLNILAELLRRRNPDFATGSAIGETVNLRQIASGMKIYPITKAATA